MTTQTLSTAARALFAMIVEDAHDWSGNPGPNIDLTPEEKGHFTALKKADVLRTDRDEGINWITFKPGAEELAKDMGLDLPTEWIARR